MSVLVSSVRRPRARTSLAVMLLVSTALVYFMLPLWWLLVAAMKSDQQINDSFGLWLAGPPELFDNLRRVFQANDGLFVHWMANTLFYSSVSALGAALAATAAGYALAKYHFRGRKAMLGMILLAVAVPPTVLVLPLFLILSAVHLTNTPLAVILPSMVNPFGVYLMWIFSQESLPSELLEAARIDGASEVNVFARVALPLLAPGFVTVTLFSFVATWNNYFLPRVVLNDDKLYPLSVGLAEWNAQAGAGAGAGSFATYSMVITGSVVAIVPLIAAFLALQRYWQSGLTFGSVKG